MVWAVEGLASEKIGAVLGKGKNAVDELFKDACRSVGGTSPKVFGSLATSRAKRQLVLESGRDNPQELRPYDWKVVRG